MNKPDVAVLDAQSTERTADSPPLQEKDFTEHAEVARDSQLENDLINQWQHEDLEPVLHWR